MSIRAINKTELNFDSCSVFELNSNTGCFEMVSNPETSLPSTFVFNNEDFIVFLVTPDEVNELIIKD